MDFKALLVVVLLGVGGYLVYTSFVKGDEEVVAPVITTPKEEARALGMVKLGGDQPYWKWYDSQGVIHFTNDASTIPKRYRSKAQFINEDEDLAKPEVPKWADDDQTVKRSLSLKFYCSKDILACQYTEKLLNQEGVRYHYRDVRMDQQARAELVALMRGKQEVPVIQYPGGYFVGYKPEEIKELLTNLRQSL